MKKKELITLATTTLLSGAVALSLTLPAFAQETTSVQNQDMSTSSKLEKYKKYQAEHQEKMVKKQDKKESLVVAKANKEIEKRNSDIGQYVEKIDGMKNLSEADKASLKASLQTEMDTMNGLKEKIANDTDPAVLKADVKSITADNRVYSLFMPKMRIMASSDKALTTINMFAAMGDKLQARVDAVKAAGKDTTALQAALDDFNAKIADAKNLNASTTSGIAALSPDGGNKSVAASNKTALEVSRKNIKAIEADLKAAYKDVKLIMGKVKGIGEVKQENATATQTAPVPASVPPVSQ